MSSLHTIWMKTYLRLNRRVLDQAAALGFSPGQPKILEFLAAQGEHEQKDIAAHCLISLPGEGIMQVIADKLHLPLHTVKMCFDITVSLIALAISLAYFRQFHGIREGTVIAAFGVGKILSLYEPLKPHLHLFMYGRETA